MEVKLADDPVETVETEVEEEELEVLNVEYAMTETMESVANVNLKAPRPPNNVVDTVTKDGVVVDPTIYAVTYNGSHAFVSIRNMAVENPEDDFEMDVTFKEYVPPPPPETTEQLPA